MILNKKLMERCRLLMQLQPNHTRAFVPVHFSLSHRSQSCGSANRRSVCARVRTMNSPTSCNADMSDMPQIHLNRVIKVCVPLSRREILGFDSRTGGKPEKGVKRQPICECIHVHIGEICVEQSQESVKTLVITTASRQDY